MLSLGTENTRTILFEDEFEYGIDPNTWVYDLGNGTDRGIPGWGNGELQSYTTENSFTENGSLIIEAREESLDNRAYTSSRMTTRGTVSFETGLLEVTAKMPEGKGLWPAIWLLGDNHFQVGWPDTGEIDIAEIKGSEPSVTHTTAHWSNFDGSHTYRGEATDTGESLADSFHVYGLEKTSSSLSWLLDGDVIYTQDLNTYPGGSEFSESFYLLLNLAVGGQWWDGNPDSTTTFPARMEIDSVKISSLEHLINLFSTSKVDDTVTGTDSPDRLTITKEKALVSAEGDSDEIHLEPDDVWDNLYAAEHYDYDGIQLNQQVSITGKGRYSAVIDGGDGVDTLILSSADDAFFYHDAFSSLNTSLSTVNDHNDHQTISRLSNIELISAGDGDDIIDLTSPTFSMDGQQLTVSGGGGNDILWGNDGHDTLNGDNGNDQLAAGRGYNSLNGGIGADTFQFTAIPSINRITDFNIEQNDEIIFFMRSNQDSVNDVSQLTTNSSLITETLTFPVDTSLESGSGASASIESTGPSGSEGSVLAITKPSSSAVWAYTIINKLTNSSEFIGDNDKTISLDAWSPVQGTRILLKLEEQQGLTNAIELEKTIDNANTWQTLTWDFSNLYTPAASYTKAVLFIDGGASGNDSHTYYFDNMEYEVMRELTTGEQILTTMDSSISLTEEQRNEIANYNDAAFKLSESYLMVDSAEQTLTVDIIQTEFI